MTTTTHTTARGSLSVTMLSPRATLFVAQGHLCDVLAGALVEEGTRLAALGGVHAFHDWSQVRSYASEARERCTSFMLRHRHAFAHVTLFVSSPVVAMGVSVANLALGGIMTAVTDPAAFARAVEQARGSRTG